MLAREPGSHVVDIYRCTHVLEGVDALGGLLDLATNDLRDELGDQLLESAAGSLTLDDLGHLLADGTDLR